MKTCNDCGLEKPLSKFHKKSDNKDGLNNFCSPCCSIRQREHRARRAGVTDRAASKHKFGGPYKVVYCPCDSFTSNSSFTRLQVYEMLNDEFLAIGTRFRRGIAEWEVSSEMTLREVTA